MKPGLLRAAASLCLFAPLSITSAQNCASSCQPEQATMVGGECNSVCCDSCSQRWCCDSSGDSRYGGPSLYASVNLRGSVDRLQSGGFNTAGFFPNTGSDDSETFSVGGALGVAIPSNFSRFRLECEGIYVDPFNTVTNSFAPPTPTFFYQTECSDRWAVLGNFWWDVPLSDRYDLYAGGGIGGGGATMSVADNVVQGAGSSTDLVWQVGCGLTRHGERCTLDLGYRYLDWGTSSVELTVGGAAPAGSFTADIYSHQVFLGIRYDCLGSLLRR